MDLEFKNLAEWGKLSRKLKNNRSFFWSRPSEDEIAGWRLQMFTCDKEADGRILFRNEMGLIVDQNGYTPSKSSENVVIDLRKRLEDRFIHAQTCVSRWEGEDMDRDHAVGLLCDLDEKQPETFPR